MWPYTTLVGVDIMTSGVLTHHNYRLKWAVYLQDTWHLDIGQGWPWLQTPHRGDRHGVKWLYNPRPVVGDVHTFHCPKTQPLLLSLLKFNAQRRVASAFRHLAGHPITLLILNVWHPCKEQCNNYEVSGCRMDGRWPEMCHSVVNHATWKPSNTWE